MTLSRSPCTTVTTSSLLVISGVSDLWKAVGIPIGSLNLQWISAYTESIAVAVILQCIFNTHDEPNQLQVIFHNLLTVTQPPGWDCVAVYSNPGNYFGFIPLSVPKPTPHKQVLNEFYNQYFQRNTSLNRNAYIDIFCAKHQTFIIRYCSEGHKKVSKWYMCMVFSSKLWLFDVYNVFTIHIECDYI